MGTPESDRALERRRAALRAGVALLVVLAPLPFGAVGPRSVLALEWSAVVLAALALTIVRRDPDGLSRRARPMLIPVGVLLAVGLVQWIPLPATADASGPIAGWRHRVAAVLPELTASTAPHSLDPTATLDAWLRLGAYALIGFAATVAVRRRAHLIQLAWVVVIAAAGQSLYGIGEYLSGHQHVLGYAKQAYTDSATGTFINRNHFAGYLAMALPIALGLALGLDGDRRPVRGSWRERLLFLSRAAGLRASGAALAAGAIWAGIVLSYSRSGMVVALLAGTLVAARAPRRRRRWRLAALIAVLALPTVLLLGQEVRAPGERFFAASPELTSLAGRVPVWRASLGMVADYPLLGTGYGTFEGAFASYRPVEVRKLWAHAHNDWLQALTEGGVLVPLALLAILLLALTRRGLDDGRRALLVPVGAALLAIAFQSAIDFSLRIPANAALCACLVGLTCIRARRVDPSVTLLPFDPQRPRGLDKERTS